MHLVDRGVDEDLGLDLDPGLLGEMRHRPLIATGLIQGEPRTAPEVSVPLPPSGDDGALAGARADALGVTLAQLAESPTTYLGRRVAVTAMVREVNGRQVAVVADVQPLQYERMLVVSSRPLPGSGPTAGRLFNLQGSIVRITGTVRRADPAQLSSYAGIAVDRAALADVTSELAIVADGLTRFVPLNRVADTPEAFAGTSVGTTGTIESILDPHALVLRDPDPLQAADLLVVSRTPLWRAGQNQTHPFVFAGNQIHVTGTVRQADLAALERELGIAFDDRVRVRFAERPVIVAQEISAR